MTDAQPQNVLERYMTPIAVLLAGVLIAGAVAYNRSGPAQVAETPEPAIAADISKVKLEGSPAVGRPDAPVTIAVWFDYQCPHCTRLELETINKLKTEYVDTGKLRIVFKDFQFLGPNSETAALFARAMWEAYPDRFYEWHHAMAVARSESNGTFGDLASIEALTKTLPGIDAARVTSLMNEKKATYQAAIEADREEGASFGINGTPGTIIGTTFINGAMPYDQFKAAIDAELK